jgi:hypothetical protein
VSQDPGFTFPIMRMIIHELSQVIHCHPVAILPHQVTVVYLADIDIITECYNFMDDLDQWIVCYKR